MQTYFRLFDKDFRSLSTYTTRKKAEEAERRYWKDVEGEGGTTRIGEVWNRCPPPYLDVDLWIE